MEPIVGLLRRFVVDCFNRHDLGVCRDLMEPTYRLRIGDHVIAGRDEQYVPAVRRQFEQFPGIGMTVHRVVACGDRVALQFSEHGASGGPGGPVACWAGIALYQSNGERLIACFAEEDYLARRRQLTTGVVDPIDPPAPAPWDSVAGSPDPHAEQVVRRWLAKGRPTAGDGVASDDEHLGVGLPLVVDVAETEVTEIFSSGSAVAFRARQMASYVSGFPDCSASARPVPFCSAGIVSVVDGEVRSGKVVRDRMGLRKGTLAR